LKVEEKILRKRVKGIEEKAQREVEDPPNQEDNNIRMKQEAQVANHHRGENLAEEDLCPEEEGKEEIFGVIHVENGDTCHGTILITNSQVIGLRMWLRQSQNHLDLLLPGIVSIHNC